MVKNLRKELKKACCYNKEKCKIYNNEITIISGSNRKDSASRKVSNYIKNQLEKNGNEVQILDMYEMDLPM